MPPSEISFATNTTIYIPPRQKSFSLDVYHTHRFGAPVRAGLIARVHGITFDTFRDEFFKPLEEIIDVRPDPKGTGDWVYQARHSLIAEIVYQEVIRSVSDRFDHIMRVVGKLNPAYSYDREIMFELVRASALAVTFTDKKFGRAIYEKVIASIGSDVGILHQWAIYEMRLANCAFDLNVAESKLSEARELAPRNTRVQHSIAELALKRSMLAEDEVERGVLAKPS